MKWSDIISVVEGILSIIVSLIAIWGSIMAWSSGFISRLDNMTHHFENTNIIQDIEADFDKMTK